MCQDLGNCLILLSLSFSPSLYLSLSFFPSLSLPPFLLFFFFLSLSVSFSFSLFLFPTLFLFLSLFFSFSISLSLMSIKQFFAWFRNQNIDSEKLFVFNLCHLVWNLFSFQCTEKLLFSHCSGASLPRHPFMNKLLHLSSLCSWNVENRHSGRDLSCRVWKFGTKPQVKWGQIFYLQTFF